VFHRSCTYLVHPISSTHLGTGCSDVFFLRLFTSHVFRLSPSTPCCRWMGCVGACPRRRSIPRIVVDVVLDGKGWNWDRPPFHSSSAMTRQSKRCRSTGFKVDGTCFRGTDCAGLPMYLATTFRVRRNRERLPIPSHATFLWNATRWMHRPIRSRCIGIAPFFS